MYKLTHKGHKKIIFWSKKLFQPKYHGKSPPRPVLDVFSLPENESGIHLSPKNLDQALGNLSTLAVQHCTMASIDIMAAWPTHWCDFCCHTAQSAAFPVKLCQYVSMKHHDQLKNLQITSTGHTLRHSHVHFFASSNLVL